MEPSEEPKHFDSWMILFVPMIWIFGAVFCTKQGIIIGIQIIESLFSLKKPRTDLCVFFFCRFGSPVIRGKNCYMVTWDIRTRRAVPRCVNFAYAVGARLKRNQLSMSFGCPVICHGISMGFIGFAAMAEVLYIYLHLAYVTIRNNQFYH